MDIFIRWDKDKNGFQLPINPESYTYDGKQNNTSVYINDLGEINLKGKRSLKTVSWSGCFPAQAYPFCRCTPLSPMDYIKMLDQCLEDNKQMHVVIGTKVNIFATIESFQWSDAEQNGDINYTVTFKEDRQPGVAKRTTKEVVEQTYTWKKGDTWARVCKKLLGDSSYAAANKKRNAAVIKKAKKKNKGKKEAVALIGYKVVISK